MNWLLKIYDWSSFIMFVEMIWEKDFFSFIIQSRHFIVGRFHQKRIHCKEMDLELWIRKISKIFSLSLKLNSRDLCDQPIFQSIFLKEWYSMMGVGRWSPIWINMIIIALLILCQLIRLLFKTNGFWIDNYWFQIFHHATQWDDDYVVVFTECFGCCFDLSSQLKHHVLVFYLFV